MSDTLLTDQSDGLLTITFNRPESLNSFNTEMAMAAADVLRAAESDAQIRAILLRGAGRGFSSGGDLAEIAADPADMITPLNRLIEAAHGVLRLMARVPQPVIAAVDGIAAGVGLSLVAASDLAFASARSKFTTAYSNIGGSPDGGLTWYLPRKIGAAKAMELIMMGESFTAEQAAAWGLLNRVIADADFESEVTAFARRVAQGPTGSYTGIKQMLHRALRTDLDSQLDLEAANFLKAARRDDFAIGLTAFKAKETPRFTGR